MSFFDFLHCQYLQQPREFIHDKHGEMFDNQEVRLII